MDKMKFTSCVPVSQCTDCIVQSWSDRWRSPLALGLRWRPPPRPPSSPRRFWALLENLMKARWEFSCGRPDAHRNTYTHMNISTRSDFTHHHHIFNHRSYSADVLSPIRWTPGKNLSSLLGICDRCVILHLCHSGNLDQKNILEFK